MRNLSGRDLARLRMGIGLFVSLEHMSRVLRRAALRTPKHWIWRYGWSLIEEILKKLWTPAKGDPRTPSPDGSGKTSVES